MLRHKLHLRLVSEIDAADPEHALNASKRRDFCRRQRTPKALVEIRLLSHTIDKSDVRPGICPYEGIVHTVLQVLSPAGLLPPAFAQ